MHDAPVQTDPLTAGPDPSWEVAKLFPRQGDWTEDDYLALDTNRLVELSDGNIEVLEMASELHQLIVSFIVAALNAFVQAGDLGKVLFAPLPVRLWGGKFREPDVLFMAREHYDRRHAQYWDGADLVIEVLSDDRSRDLAIKRAEYARAGIPEYWIVDPLEQSITVLVLVGGAYESIGVYRAGERAASRVLPGFSLDVRSVLAVR